MMFSFQLMEVCEDILVNRNQMFHCSLERDDNQRQACTSKRCSIIKTCQRSAKLNMLIIKDQSDGWNVFPQVSKFPSSLQNFDRGRVDCNLHEHQNLFKTTKTFDENWFQNMKCRILQCWLVTVVELWSITCRTCFFAQFHHLLWSEVDTNFIKFHRNQEAES